MWVYSQNKIQRFILIFSIVLVGVAVDQFTKKLAVDRHAVTSQESFYLGNFVRITYAENTGAFLSLGQKLPDTQRFWVMTGLNSLILLMVAGVLLLKNRLYFPVVIALSLVVCGGVGNLIDRIFRDGIVIDFLVVGIQSMNIPFRTGIFNVADFLIMLGLGLLIFCEFFSPKANFEAPDKVNPKLTTLESHKGKDGT